MTKSNYRRAEAAGEKVNKEVVCCMDCFWANLHRYGNNPVLAQCTKKPNPGNARFPYKVEVASARWICPHYKHQDGEKFIQQRIIKYAA